MTTITSSHSPDTKRIVAALFAEDDIGSVIRCHFEAERSVDHVLSVLSKGKYNSDKTSMRFLSQKLDVLRLFGIHDNFLAPVKLLNSHRNDFAHHGKEHLTASDLDSMKKLVQIAIPKYTDEFRISITGRRELDAKLGDLSIKQQYVLYISTAHFTLSSVVGATITGETA